MSANKFYAVKVGRTKGIFLTWDECKKNVDGYPNAIYKSFLSHEQAQAYLQSTTKPISISSESDEDVAIAYIDGSYSDKLKRYSYAVLVFINGEKITYSASDDNIENIKMRNVAGELQAAMCAMAYAEKYKKNKLIIYYDYAGIERWASGNWKANTPYTQDYVEYVRRISETIKISFIKVKAHSGNPFNEEVDQLARLALSEDNSFSKPTSEFSIGNSLTEKYSSILAGLPGNKKTLKMHLLNDSNQIIDTEIILSLLKNKWKTEKRAFKDIQEFKIVYDIPNEAFIVGIYTSEDEYIYRIGSDELNG